MLTGNVYLNVNGDLDLGTGSELELKDSSNVLLSGDLINNGTLTPGLSYFTLDGSADQNINGATTFSYLTFSKASGNIILGASTDISINNDIAFNSTSGGIVDGSNGQVIVVGQASRAGTGHVEGVFAQYTASGDNPNKLIPIGMGGDYVPVEFDMDGTGGTAGYVEFYVEALDQWVAPSTISIPEVVERQWIAQSGSGFDIGNRTYDIVINYLNPDDLRNGADPDSFLVARKTTFLWELPTVGAITTSSVEGLSNDSLGLFIVGPEAEFLTFYSRESGVWSEGDNWSLYGFGSYPSPIAPRTQDFSYIGDSDTLTLDSDISTVAGRGVYLVNDTVSTGALFTESYVIDGGGEFSMVAGSTLGVGSPDGINAAPAASGNIQTATRSFNPGNHNDGIFVYNSSDTTGLSIGDALPSTMQDLIIRAGGVLDLPNTITVTDDLLIETGGLDIGIQTVNGGDRFFVDSAATVAFGGTNDFTAVTGFADYNLHIASITEFNGTNQVISNLPLGFDRNMGYGHLWIRNTGTASTNDPILVRSNLINYPGASIDNAGMMSSITVYERLINEGTITNSATIYIGESP